MPANLRPRYDVSRTDRVIVNEGSVVTFAEKFRLDRTCLLGAANAANIGWTESSPNSADTIIVPKGSAVAVNNGAQLTLPGCRADATNVAITTTTYVPTSTTLARPIGIVSYDVKRYQEDTLTTYGAGYKRSTDVEGNMAVVRDGYIELPIVIVSGTLADVNVAPNVMKWGAVVTDDYAHVYNGCYLNLNGFGQFVPQANAGADKGLAYGQVVFIWGATTKNAHFLGALSYLGRRNNYIMGQDGEPPISTVENTNSLHNAYIIDNDAFGAGDHPSGYIRMARVKLMFD